MSDYWYEHKDELWPDMVFDTIYEGLIVRLNRRVPGDGTKWYADTWDSVQNDWVHEDHTIEPSDLKGQPLDWFDNDGRVG